MKAADKRVALAHAESIFRSHFPSARVEGQTGNDRKRYFLVRRNYTDSMPFGEGNTKQQAWRDACDRAGVTEAKS